ncbi:phage tail length tape measure family protein [Rhodoferax sp.]|nr:phage tail length tape measure family protein [Rhodoferax sp.]MDP1943341.1 phage tail length tape measure family protein [Rhodoferax sp.]
MSRSLGSLVVRIVADGLGLYKAEMNALGDATEKAASKIDKSAKAAGAAAAQMGGGVAHAADAAQALKAGAGMAGVGVAAFAVILGAATYAAYKGSQEQIEYQKALTLTGNVAGTTVGQMADMARAIGQNVGTQYQAAAALTALAGTGQVAGSSLQKFGEVAVQMQRTMSASVQDTAKEFAELGQEPVKASLKLNEATHYLTASTFEQIRAAKDMGDAEKAASLAQDAYATAMKERTAEIEASLGTLQKVWRGLKDEAKSAWDAMLGLGRTKTNAQLLDAAQNEYANGRATGSTDAELKMMATKVDLLKGMIASEVAAAEAVGQRTRAESAGVKAIELVSAANAKALTKQEQMNKALGAYRKGLEDIRAVNPASALLDPAQIAKTEAGIADKYKETGRSGSRGSGSTKVIDEAAKGVALYNDLVAKSNGFTAQYAEQMHSLALAAAKGALSVDEVAQAVALINAQQPGVVAAARAEAEALAAIEKARNSAALAHAKELESLNGKAQTLEDEVAMYGMSKAAIEELTIARMLDRIEVLKGFDNSAEAIAMIEQEIAARRRLARAGTALDDRKDADKAAQEAEKETKHIADTLHNDVKNALSNAFRDTKNPIAAFGDALGNVIFTRVTNSLADAMATQLLNNGMVKGFMSLFGFADGGSFEQGGVQAFANGGTFTNSIVSEPTLFKFASGTGMMGEAGPEAIMPLTRAPNGKLGVQATSAGGGNRMVVNIIESPGNGGQQARRTENGVDILDVFVDKVKSAIAGDISRGSGAVPNAMSRTYGLNRVAGAY